MARLQFEWDESKPAANLAKHGISFPAATQLLIDTNVMELDTTRQADKEARHKIVGMVEGRLFIVVYTRRGDVHRLISARRANRKEERAWSDLR